MPRPPSFNEENVLWANIGFHRKQTLEQTSVLLTMSMAEITRAFIDEMFSEFLEKRGLRKVNGTVVRL